MSLSSAQDYLHNRLLRDICSSYDWIESYAIDDALKTVLAHNDEPTSLQATSFASSKEHIDLAHHHITEDIDTLDRALHLLRARRHSLHRLSVRHAGALSTFRRLPDEILSEIFLHACGDEPIRVARLREGPWKLREVCRKWASIVEGSSNLWCNMSIDIADENVNDENVDPIAFSQALKFCGSRTIQMKLSVNERYRPVRWNLLFGVLDTIASSSPKWETLCIRLAPFCS